MHSARRPLRSADIRWAIALTAALFAAVACASPVPTSQPTSPPAVAATALPATGISVAAAQPSAAVVHLSAADEFERLRGQGQPVLLAVLDRSRADDGGLNDG